MSKGVTKRFVLRNDQVKANASRFIQEMSLGDGDTTLEVIVQKHRAKRSLSQNAMYWDWITIIGDSLGYSKDAQHGILKVRFLLPILVRDDPDVAALAERVQGNESLLSNMLSTSDLSVKQFTEYLDDINEFAGRMGIRLPHPEDVHYREKGYV